MMFTPDRKLLISTRTILNNPFTDAFDPKMTV